MARNRKEAENFIMEYVNKIAPGKDNFNKNLYINFFKKMSDDEFDNFIKDLDSGVKNISIVCPNFSDIKLSVKNNFDIAKELGHSFFKRLWVGAHNGLPKYLSNIPYLVVDLPVRRLSQSVTKKIKVPEDNSTVDFLTGQPTGKSEGAAISLNELQVLSAMNLEKASVELIKYRGGDQRGYRAMSAQIAGQGTASLDTLKKYASGVVSTKTLSTFLNCMHLKSTL